jgi:retron-type reverse transcriptase
LGSRRNQQWERLWLSVNRESAGRNASEAIELRHIFRGIKKLDENLADLTERLHKGTYRPLPKKRVFIHKANGKQRPIAISAFEDKLVEWLLLPPPPVASLKPLVDRRVYA